MFNNDASIFVPVNSYGQRGFGIETDPAYTREDIVNMIARQEMGFDRLVRVFEMNPTEGWSRDITDEILLAAAVLREARGLQAAE